MYVKFSNNMEAEKRGSYLDVDGIECVMSRSWHCRKEQTISYYIMTCEARIWKHAWEKRRSEFDFKAKYHLGKANVDVVPWSRKKE
ncbi:hypothetical protein Tco_0353384 [Tanacetum coccineum]